MHHFRSVLAWVLIFGVFVISVCPAWAEVEVFTSAEMGLLDQTAVGQSHTVQLPYNWDRMHGNAAGRAVFSVRLDAADSSQTMAVFIPRLGNQFQILVNEIVVYHTPEPGVRGNEPGANEPVFVVIPDGLVAAKSRLEVLITAQPGKQAGMGPIYWGPANEVRPLFEKRYWLEVRSRQILGVITAVLGIFGLLMSVRLKEKAFLFYGLSELLWTILTVRTLIDPALFSAQWGPFLIYKLPLFLAPPMLYKALLSLLGAGSGRLSRSMNWTMWAAPVFALMAVNEFANVVVIAYSLWQLLFVFILVWVSISSVSLDKLWERSTMTVILVALALCSVRDVFIFQFSDQAYLATSWLRLAWIAIGVSFAWITVERLYRSDVALATLNASLNDQLAARNAELELAFERNRLAEKERGAIEERQRIVRDLHDGLGSQLHGALRMAQMADASKQDVAAQLVEAIDQMKITVDAMQETEGDIPAILGAVRYRLSPRLAAAGILLQWDVQRLPQMHTWTVKHAFQLQMFLLEAFTNMMVHSGASSASLSAQLDQNEADSWVVIRVTDDGVGFDAQTGDHKGKGMSSMRMRATALDATLTVTSATSGTDLCLRIPLRFEPHVAHR